MNLLLKKFLVIVAALLIAIPVASAILALLLGMTIQEGFFILVLVTICVICLLRYQYRKEQEALNAKMGQVNNIIQRMAHQALSSGSWGNQKQTLQNMPPSVSWYNPYPDLKNRRLYIKIQMVTPTRAPLSQTQQAILQQAINADLQQVLGQPGQMVTSFTVYPIYTANTYEIADVEVQL